MSLDPLKNIEYTWEWCQSLLERNVYEGLTIDFKESYYDIDSFEGAAKLLKHVTGFANSSGGHLVFGVLEEGGRIKSLQEVELSDMWMRKYSTFLEKNLNPKIQTEVNRIPNPDNPSSGVLVINIPESVIKPVGGISNGRLIFAKRTGESSEFMSEAQLASMYKSRFEGDWEGATRLNELEMELTERLNLEKCWVLLSGRPRFRGNLPINAENFARISERFHNITIGGGLLPHKISTVAVGYRSVVLKDSTQLNLPSDYFYANLFDDGSFSIALALDGKVENRNIDFSERMPMADLSITEECLTESLLTAFEIVIAQCLLADSKGTLDLQASVKGAPKTSLTILKTNSDGVTVGRPYPTGIVHTERIRSHKISFYVEDLVKVKDGRLLPLKFLLDGLLNNFGFVQSSFFDTENRLNLLAWPESARRKTMTYIDNMTIA